MKVYSFALYILVTWEPPVEPNGIITNYRTGSAKYEGSEPKDTLVEMTELEASKRRYLIGKEVKQEELTNYVVEIQAKTEPGYGESVRIPTKTVKVSGKSRQIWKIISITADTLGDWKKCPSVELTVYENYFPQRTPKKRRWISVYTEEYYVRLLLMSNERRACFLAEKWRFHKTDPHSCVALS